MILNDKAKECNNISLFSKLRAVVDFLQVCVNFFLLLRKKYRNYLTVLLGLLKKEYPIRARLRTGQNTIFNSYNELYTNLLGVNCDTKNDVVDIDGLKFYGGVSNADSIKCFIDKEYDFLPVKDRAVIDIGANIGDSCIYFILKGARSVLAIEPNDTLYNFAKKNIYINGFSDKIKIVRAACSGNDLNTNVDASEPLFITLDDIILKCPGRPSNLKIDCEGCEYDVILSASCDTLSNFTHIQIEYHHGYQNLKRKLEECGFQVQVTQPSYFISPFANITNNKLITANNNQTNQKRIYSGMLYASRK